GGFLTDVSSHDPVLSVREVLDLVVHNVGGSLELVRAGSERTAQAGDVSDRGVDVGQSSSRCTGRGESIRSQGRAIEGTSVNRHHAHRYAGGAGGSRVAHEDRERAVSKDGLAVVGRVATDGVDFVLDRGELGIQSGALSVADRAGRGFSSQRDGAVQERGDLRQGAISDL